MPLRGGRNDNGGHWWAVAATAAGCYTTQCSFDDGDGCKLEFTSCTATETPGVKVQALVEIMEERKPLEVGMTPTRQHVEGPYIPTEQ